MPRLGLSFLGSFQVKLDGVPVTGFEADKVRALLVYLAVESSRPHRREQLSSLFWPGWPDASARTSLRNALSNLRKSIGDETAEPPFLFITRETIQFNPDSDYSLDIAEIERLTRDSHASLDQLETAAALYRGAFLESFTLKDCPAFDDWSLAVKEQLQAQASGVLDRLGEMYEKGKEYEKAITCARQRLTLEPWQEDAHRQLIHLLALSGQRPAALAQFEACKRALKSELGVEPSAETVRLYESIRLSHSAEPSQAKAHSHNLPAQLTSFIGREKEIEQVKSLLKTYRIVTLTGPGGTGKTRLSQQVALELLEDYQDGVWLVELAPLADPDLVVQTTARALGMDLDMSSQALPSLQNFLESKHLLLILDNCEHLLESCAHLADALLRACPRLHILATSREAFGIEGEAPAPIPPLRLPEAPDSLPLAGLAQVDAIRLFVERAAMISPEFQLTEQNAPAIVQICRRLDGIPLALELAAARVKLLRVEDIAGRLDDRFRLLTGGSRTALPRYQTLRASIDWSYDLLLPAERSLLQRLSVFSGGWVLEAAERVGSGEGIEPLEILDLLGQLVNKSLVTAQAEDAPERRYHMLETIRQYAHEKLVESGESELIRDQHLMYYVALAENVEDKIRGPEQRYLLSLLEDELANIRLAIEWSTSSSTSRNAERIGWLIEQGLRLATALHWFWHCRGRLDEGSHWLISLLARQTNQGAIPGVIDELVSPTQAVVRARALEVVGWQVNQLGDAIKAKELLMESQDLYTKLGLQGTKGYACVLYSLGGTAAGQGNPNLAVQYLEESLAIFQEMGDRLWIGECLENLGRIFLVKHDYERARIYFEKSLTLYREIGDQEGTAFILHLLGAMILFWLPVADTVLEAQACAFLEESRELFYQSSNIDSVSIPVNNLATYYWRKGDYQKAEAYFKEAHTLGQKLVFTTNFAIILNNLGMFYLSQGDDQKAVDLFNESLVISQKQDYQKGIAYSLYSSGLLAWEVGDFKRAGQNFTQAVAICQKIGLSNLVAQASFGLARVSLRQNEYGKARVFLEQALEIFQNGGIPTYIYSALEAFALLAARRPETDSEVELEKACRILGATQAWHLKWQLTRTPRERAEREETIAAVRERLGAEVFEKVWEEGKAMKLEQAVAYVVEEHE